MIHILSSIFKLCVNKKWHICLWNILFLVNLKHVIYPLNSNTNTYQHIFLVMCYNPETLIISHYKTTTCIVLIFRWSKFSIITCKRPWKLNRYNLWILFKDYTSNLLITRDVHLSYFCMFLAVFIEKCIPLTQYQRGNVPPPPCWQANKNYFLFIIFDIDIVYSAIGLWPVIILYIHTIIHGIASEVSGTQYRREIIKYFLNTWV